MLLFLTNKATKTKKNMPKQSNGADVKSKRTIIR